MRYLIFLLLLPLFSAAQTLPTVEEKTKGLQKAEGFISFYTDEATGKLRGQLAEIENAIRDATLNAAPKE